MRLLGYFLGACVVLALLQAAIKLVVLIVVLGCFVAFVRRPRETIALVITLGVLNLVTLYPLAALGVVGALAAGKALFRWGKGAGPNPQGGQDDPRMTNRSGATTDQGTDATGRPKPSK